MENKLLYSNTPIYLPSFLRQYCKQVTDYRLVNWKASLPSYQAPFVESLEVELVCPQQVVFPFMGKNCWLWEDEYALVEAILPRVVQMTITYSHQLGVGPAIPIFTQSSEQVEDLEYDLLSGSFRVVAVLLPS